jgi:putative ABC transport system permease protein
MMCKTKEPRPSRLSQWLIKKIFRDEVEANLGDFLEIYTDFVEKGGRLQARFRFYAYLILSIPKYFKDTLSMEGTMLKNYLKIAFRNMRRNKAYTFINISGLAIGLASCFFIMLWVQNELSYDRFHEKADRMCRINIRLPRGTGDLVSAYSTSALGPAFKEEFPEVIEAARFKIVADKKSSLNTGIKTFLRKDSVSPIPVSSRSSRFPS